VTYSEQHLLPSTAPALHIHGVFSFIMTGLDTNDIDLYGYNATA
jgi:hypothetical protein